MKLQRSDRREQIARAKWHYTHVFVPDQEPQGWKHDLERMKSEARERRERYKVEVRSIRVAGKIVICIVFLAGPKPMPKPLWIGGFTSKWSYEIVTTGAHDTDGKRNILSALMPLPTVESRPDWPVWLLAVEEGD